MIANNRIVAGDIDKVQALAILVKKKLADLTFLLGILHFIYNDHPFFAKDYICEASATATFGEYACRQ